MRTSNVVITNEILKKLLILLKVVRIVGNWDSLSWRQNIVLSFAGRKMNVVCLITH